MLHALAVDIQNHFFCYYWEEPYVCFIYTRSTKSDSLWLQWQSEIWRGYVDAYVYFSFCNMGYMQQANAFDGYGMWDMDTKKKQREANDLGTERDALNCAVGVLGRPPQLLPPQRHLKYSTHSLAPSCACCS